MLEIPLSLAVVTGTHVQLQKHGTEGAYAGRIHGEQWSTFHFCSLKKGPSPTFSWKSHHQQSLSKERLGPALMGVGRDRQPPQRGINKSRLLRKARRNHVQRAFERFLCMTGVLVPCLDAIIWPGMSPRVTQHTPQGRGLNSQHEAPTTWPSWSGVWGAIGFAGQMGRLKDTCRRSR